MTSKYFISSISISLETAYESAICLEQICLEVSRSQDEKILAYHASLLLWPVPNACASRDTPTGLTREDGVRMSWGRRSKLSFEDVTHSPLSATCTPWSIEPHSHKRNRTATVAPQILLKRIIGKSSGLFVYIMISWDIQYSESRHSQVSFTAKNRFGLHLSSFTDLQCQLLLSLACHLRSTCECYKTTCLVEKVILSVSFSSFFNASVCKKKNPHLQSWFGFGKLGQRVVFVLIL